MQTDTKIADLEEYAPYLIRKLEQTQLRQLIQTYTHDKEVENIIMTGAEALIQQSEYAEKYKLNVSSF